MSNVEWLWTSGIDFDSYATAVPEKLSKHNFAVMLNRMEEGKLQTAHLCIHDVLTAGKNPNIIIICPENLTGNWYYSLLWDMGLEFKFYGVYEKSLDLFSDTAMNLCIVSSDALQGNSAVQTALLNSGIVWDLMIIDMPLSALSENIALDSYTKNIKTKTKKLLINTPASDVFGAKYEKLSAVAKALMHNGKKNADHPVNLSDDGNAVAGRNMTGDYNVKTINYKIDGALYAKTERIDDTRSGIPLYSYGGNIFEEYNLPERSVYLSNEYDKVQLKALLAADAKLEAFLKEIVTLLSDSENRIVVYCTSGNTMNYVSKALWACNGGKKGICVYDSNSTDAEFVKGEFFGESAEEPNIIVADDSAGARFFNVEQITHIINYEYPENPVVLEQRLTRAGRKAMKNNSPAFYIFCDEDYKFDGRMLRKTVLSNIGGAFSGVSDKSLLFDFENIEEHLIVLILDLKFIADNAKDDIVESFRVEYNAPEVKTAKDAAATAKKRLEKLVGIFGLNDVLKQGELDGEQLFMQISEKIEKFKGKKVSLDGKGVLHISGANKSPAEPKEFPETKKAVDFAKKLTGKKEDFELIKNEIEKLQDAQKLSVLISVWKYFKYELKIPKSYKEFMKLYNSI